MYNYLLVTKNIHIFARVSQFEIRDFSRFSVFEVYFNAILHIYNLHHLASLNRYVNIVNFGDMAKPWWTIYGLFAEFLGYRKLLC